jgi:hypothetical protein
LCFDGGSQSQPSNIQDSWFVNNQATGDAGALEVANVLVSGCYFQKYVLLFFSVAFVLLGLLTFSPVCFALATRLVSLGVLLSVVALS